jgi:hypothetical protein
VCNGEDGLCADPHDVGNRYTWSASGDAFDGSIVGIFLNQLNNRCDHDATKACTSNADCSGPGGACGFAGHRDWRLPNRKEFDSILDFEFSGPPLDVAFHGANCGNTCSALDDPSCACDAVNQYWGSTTFAANTGAGYLVNTANGYWSAFTKTGSAFARAVRSGA